MGDLAIDHGERARIPSALLPPLMIIEKKGEVEKLYLIVNELSPPPVLDNKMGGIAVNCSQGERASNARVIA